MQTTTKTMTQANSVIENLRILRNCAAENGITAVGQKAAYRWHLASGMFNTTIEALSDRNMPLASDCMRTASALCRIASNCANA